jgi:hypothetical protein
MDEAISLLQPIEPNASPCGQIIFSYLVVLNLQPASREYKSANPNSSICHCGVTIKRQAA